MNKYVIETKQLTKTYGEQRTQLRVRGVLM